MQCHNLSKLFGSEALVAGARAVNEPYTRPGCELSPHSLEILHEGKDASIISMLHGGNGYPSAQNYDLASAGIFDLACTEERRDMRALLAWQSDLSLCLADRKKGATT